MDIESLSRICLKNIQKITVNRPQVSPHQLLELLERLERAETWEQENYSMMNQEQSEENEPPIMMVPSLPSLRPLLITPDNPKDIIFDAFLSEQNIPSLTAVTPSRVSLLLKAIPMAVNAQPLLSEECALLQHFLETQSYDYLQTFLYQKLMHGYLDSSDLYVDLVAFLLDSFPSFEVAGEVIKRLPLITDNVWTYIWKHSHNLLHLLRELVLTYEEGSKGIEEIFSMVNSDVREVQDHAISLIANQLYTICPEIINLKSAEIFEKVCLENTEESGYQAKVKLFFKLLGKNPDLLECFVRIFPQISLPSLKSFVLQVYAKALNKKIAQNHPVLLEALENTSSIFALDTLNILSQLRQIHIEIKQLLLNKAVAGDYQIISYLAPHLNMDDISNLFSGIVQLPDSVRRNIIQSIIEAPGVDACELLVMVHKYQGNPAQIVKVVKELMDMRHAFSPEIIQKAAEKIIRFDPLPDIIMYFILKANEMYPQMRTFFITYALPYLLLERKVWEYSIIWKGCITFIEKTVPDSICLLDQLPLDIQLTLLQRDAIKKGKLEESLRKNNRRFK